MLTYKMEKQEKMIVHFIGRIDETTVDLFKEALDKVIAGEDREQQIHLVRDLCDLMLNGSLCAMGGMTPYPVLSAMDHFPEDFGISHTSDKNSSAKEAA